MAAILLEDIAQSRHQNRRAELIGAVGLGRSARSYPAFSFRHYRKGEATVPCARSNVGNPGVGLISPGDGRVNVIANNVFPEVMLEVQSTMNSL